MLYCLCTNRWEKDVEYLNSINSEYLIEQIVREYNTLEQLKFLLQRLVKTVNKPNQYMEIAKIIYLAIGQLYPEFQQQHGGRLPQSREAQPAANLSTSANVDPSSTDSSSVPSAIYRAYAPEPTQVSSIEVPSAIQRAYAPEPTQVSSIEVPSAIQRAYAPEPTYVDAGADSYAVNNDGGYAYETYYTPEAPPEVPPEQYVVPEYDPFVLRQNVMSYTNPLRAKIIMVLMLRPHFDFGNQVSSAMREYHLDDLLFEILRNFTSVASLEESMTAAVEQLIEVEEYGKTATGLLQSLIPLYAS
jgi:hypothetical protein